MLEHTALGMLPINPALEERESVCREAGNEEGSDVNWLTSRRSSIKEVYVLKDGTAPEILFVERSSVRRDCGRVEEFEKAVSGVLSDCEVTIL